jgi:phosphoglycolate phosphatase
MVRIHRKIQTDTLRLLVFDLDGTLIDSSKDLCNSVNATLEHFGLRPLPDQQIATFIGDGAGMLIRRALLVPGELPAGIHEEDEEFFQQALEYFLVWYRAHKLDYTRVYAGVMESLEAIAEAQNRPAMVVLTNKPVGPARAICEGLGLAKYFEAICGGDSFATKKPDPEGLLHLMDRIGARPETTLMIGDSEVDVKTARNVGAWSMGCSFGLSPESMREAKPDIEVEHAAQWVEVLGAQIGVKRG